MEEEKKYTPADAKWYILQTQYGYESIAESSLKQLVELNNLGDFIFDIVVPEEEEIVERNGKRKVVKRKKYPNYIFIKMIYTKHIWFLVKNTRGIKDFCSGYDGKPIPMSDDEVKRTQLEKITIDDLKINVGDHINILSGPLQGFMGEVKEIKAETEKVKATVMLFGRESTVELDFGQVEKL